MASWYHYYLNNILWSAQHNTAASREFKRGSLVSVTNIQNNKSVIVLINDYGPDKSIHPEREIDLSYHAFNMIADPGLGLINIKYKKVGVDPNFKSKYD